MILSAIMTKRVSQTVAADIVRRGKSELHRAGCWVTPSEGDLKESATERYRHAKAGQGWKGEVRAHQHIGDFVAM